MNDDRQSFSFKPMTLYSFFPKNKRLKLAKKDSSISKKKKQNKIFENNFKENQRKNIQWSSKNNKYDYHYNFSPSANSKQSLNYLASSTSNNFYHNNMNLNTANSNNNFITRKHSMNYKRDKKIISSHFNFNGVNKFDSKEINEKYLEQYLDNYDTKLRRNKKSIKHNFTNNTNMNNNNLYIKSNKNNNIVRSTSKNQTNNYVNPTKYKNIIRLNNDKLYNFLPFLNFSAKKNKKNSPKTLKQVLLNDNYNINTINGEIRNYYNNVQTLYKNMAGNNNLLNNFNSTQKNNFFQVSLNPMISSFNNNMTANSEASNFGNNNIIFNNYGSINNNIFIENPKKNYFEENQSSNNKITSEEKHKEKVIRDFKFLKENTLKEENNTKEDLDDKEIRNKQRAFSTVPYKARKNSKKEQINIDCNNENILKEEDSNKKDKLSKYEIGQELGKGAYAKVKLAINKITKEKFAIKIYEKEKLNSNSKKSCVFKEIQILRKLNHKNIAKLIEVISTEKQILIVQELIEGISLREYYNNEIRNQKGISIHKESIFKKIFYQIFSAMDYIHKKNIAHRDIKLENILLKSNYEIKIIDFGFGMLNPEKKLQKFFCGTPNYMPPEIAEKKPYVGQLADMWSLGILVYKIFCADFPFKGKDEKELYKSIKSGKFSYAKYTPEYAKKIIGSLIVLDPNKRISCEDVLKSDWLKEK
jgi:MAP/microtubule affinity-regulating kinase/serine/threonine-protein kinase NIM1